MTASRLSTRIFLAFAGLALAILVGVAGSLFVVLRGLHADAATSALAQTVQPLVFQLRNATTAGQLRQAVADFRGQVAEGVQVYLVGPEGRALDVGEGVAGLTFPLDTAAPVGTSTTGSLNGPGRQDYLYAVTIARNPGTTGVRAIALTEPDRSAAAALRDLTRMMAAVLVILLVVGVPVVWLLSRSVTGPLRRLADATANLPARPDSAARGSAEGGSASAAAAPRGSAPLTPEGPAEVRELTQRFNGMAAELSAQRDHETRLLADLRHDLRTPLTVIGGFSEALGDGTATGDDAAMAARAIREEAARLERLVEELDTVERLRSGAAGLRPERLDAGTVVAGTVARFTAAARGRGVTVENACLMTAGGPAVAGDAGRSTGASGSGALGLELTADRVALDRILGNLVDNALAAADRPGRHVWIDARRVDVLPAAVGGRAGSPGIVFTVTDDGPGFQPGDAERAFERFYRADPSRAGIGAGLGLAIVRELARAHGGEALAENVAPRGARISVLLPLTPVAPAG